MKDLKEGELDIPYCERCDGLAVIDYGHIQFIPKVLDRAAALLQRADFKDAEDSEEAWGVEHSLRIYRDLIETMAVE